MLEAICGRNKGYAGLARDFIKPKDPLFRGIPSKIEHDERYMPYFKVIIFNYNVIYYYILI